MSIEARIKAALSGFGDPVEKSVLDAMAGKRPTKYYTFAVTSIPADFGDDEPGHERWLASVHFFAPLWENCIQRVRETKQALFAAGFTWPEMMDATDQDGQHYVLECETTEGVELAVE